MIGWIGIILGLIAVTQVVRGLFLVNELLGTGAFLAVIASILIHWEQNR